MKNAIGIRLTGVLLARYHNDLKYDCHQTETVINRSEARQELQRRGKRVLKIIGGYLLVLFPPGQKIDYDLFMGWVRLITGIIEDHGLPPPPYGPKVKYKDQTVEAWAAYCNKHG